MFGSFSKVWRNPCSAASASSELPGSVIATKCRPSATSEWKYSKSESVSTVPPDLVDTTKSERAVGRAERPPQHLRGEARSAHPEEHRVGQPVGGASTREIDEFIGTLE